MADCLNVYDYFADPAISVIEDGDRFQFLVSRLRRALDQKKPFEVYGGPLRITNVNGVPLLVDGYQRLKALKRCFPDPECAPDIAYTECDIGLESPDGLMEYIKSLAGSARRGEYILRCRSLHGLVMTGVSVSGLSCALSMTARQILTMVAVGGLDIEVHALIRDHGLDRDLAEALTTLVPAQIRAWARSLCRGESWAYSSIGIRNHYAAEQPLSRYVLFELSEYAGPAAPDASLDDCALVLQDTAQFWRLQNTAINDLARRLKRDGGNDVIVVREGQGRAWARQRHACNKRLYKYTASHSLKRRPLTTIYVYASGKTQLLQEPSS
ncbi:hypothetical protein [Eilatimonas milleporae]|uniref:Uncharacterized protein n=1 Tax=Eilatimonas milleporae TaxID=911205 RepID=A0A3M0CSH9_9PROT|nr:hypothetical protein [Eilatimonas milleporae]RMB11815.1 hypothetical protein BXY39_0299 [Eilatimonas milleporae]